MKSKLWPPPKWFLIVFPTLVVVAVVFVAIFVAVHVIPPTPSQLEELRDVVEQVQAAKAEFEYRGIICALPGAASVGYRRIWGWDDDQGRQLVDIELDRWSHLVHVLFDDGIEWRTHSSNCMWEVFNPVTVVKP